MINFNKSKYPSDHEFISVYDYTLYESIYSIGYQIECTKCNIYIRHEETVSRNTTITDLFGYWTTSFGNIYMKHNRDNIDYGVVLSCAEMMIKKLLE
jgi:hypothetical protein